MPFPLYFDDDVESRALAGSLTARGFDVLRATDAGMRGKTDAEHLAFAASVGRVLYTANRGDFLRLHAQWISERRSHARIIILTQQRYSPGEQLRRLSLLLAQRSSQEMHGRVEFLTSWVR
ncbi:MAG: DUF5615 family PIN-like protein [Dehalococcoidia bacterium]|nr:DUF5615 family PIN-like protein [Dehalococcoidia bacterium]